MAENITIARPYARAVFELASEAGELAAWSDRLELASLALDNADVRRYLDDPAHTPDDQARVMAQLYGNDPGEQVRNLLRLLADNRRLGTLPEIAELYEALRADAEGTIEVQLESVEPVSDEEQAKLCAALKNRLGREVEMQNVIDPDLIGGAVIRAGDLVIDGSVRARLEALTATLKR